MRAIRDLELGRSARPYRRSVRMLAEGLKLTDAQRSGFAALADGRDRGGAARLAVPAHLPAGVAGFAGRERELATLDALAGQAGQAPVGGTVVISAIGGTAGVGKTALAVHWARRAAARFPGGQLYVNLRGFDPTYTPLVPAEAVSGFLAALGVPPERRPSGLDAQAGLYRSLTAGKRLLVVLDNAHDVQQVRPLLPGSPGCLVLVTSRASLAGLAVSEGAQLLTLDLLTPGEARQLLAGRLGARRVEAEPAAVTELIGLCARLPLALAIASARASARPGFPLAALAAELRDASGLLDALEAGDPASSVRAVFSWSCRGLTGPAARMFRLLGLHPGPDLSAAAAASLAGVPQADARRSLHELTHAHLLTEPAPGRFALHDLLRAYAAEQAHATEGADGRDAATGRMLDHYLHTACAAAVLLSPSREPIARAMPRPGVTPEPLADRPQALAWFTAEHQVLLALVTLAAGAGFDAHAWQIPWAVAGFLDWRGYWHQRAAVLRAAVAAADRLADPAGQAESRGLLASSCMGLGEYAEAHALLASCLEHYEQTGDRAGQARIQQSSCSACQREGLPQAALGHAGQALSLFRAIGHQAGQARALSDIGDCLTQLGSYERARSACGQALSLWRETGDRIGEGHAWESLGYAEHHLGHHARAATCYPRALSTYRELGDRYCEARALSRLGDTHRAAGGPEQARQAWQLALAILTDLQHPDADDVRGKLADLE